MLTKEEYLQIEMGAIYDEDETIFRVWSPVAEEIKVEIYDKHDDEIGKVYKMDKRKSGIWELKVEGDLDEKYYNYIVNINGIERKTSDPYAKASTVNGRKSMVIDLEDTNPEGWLHHVTKGNLGIEKTIIYEAHIRDLTVSKDSGVKNKGKYLAFEETQTTNDFNESSFINHIKELGITHLHILPIYDFGSVNEYFEGYNWGYDPMYYNVPEGSYSTNAYDGKVRVRELKQMIMSLHNEGIKVVLDVVYNHTQTNGDSPFDIIYPKYYYRIGRDGAYSNGSGCGNELATEKPMVKRFIIDSLKYWMEEYKVDGFRFDLLSLYDEDTVKQIEKELRKLNSEVILYGEPWTGGLSSLDYKKSFGKGKQRNMRFALFNDHFRNDLKGDNDGCEIGFVNGRHGFEEHIKIGILANIDYSEHMRGFAEEPLEVVNYVSCHDNLTLYDKLKKTCYSYNKEEIIKANKLALSIILTSFGIPFMQAGSEFMRTKKGNHNSYNSGDEVNQILWNRKHEYIEEVNYLKGIIELRKKLSVLTIKTAKEIKERVVFEKTSENIVSYRIKGLKQDKIEEMLVIHSANKDKKKYELDENEWIICADDKKVYELKSNKKIKNALTIEPISTYILVRVN